MGSAEIIRAETLTVVVSGLPAEIDGIPLIVFINRGLSPAEVTEHGSAQSGLQCTEKNFAYLHIVGNILSWNDEAQNAVHQTVLVKTRGLFKSVIWLGKVIAGFQMWKFNKRPPEINLCFKHDIYFFN